MTRQTGPANRTHSTGRILPAKLLLLAATLALPGPSTRAAFTSVASDKNLEYAQTSAAQPTTLAVAFYDSYVTYQNTTDATTVTGNVANTGTFGYTNLPASSEFAYTPATFATSAAMDIAIVPGATFIINGSGGTLGSVSTSFTVAADTYSSVVPYLTGGSYASLQGLNAASSDTLSINGFTLPAGATEGYTFATIFGPGGTAISLGGGFLSPSTTAVTIAANTLAANTTYTLDLDYSSRVDITGTSFGTVFQLFDRRTEISFTTAPSAVPEPASLALTGFGIASALFVAGRRRRPRASA